MQSNIEMMNFVVRLLNANLPSYYYYHNYEHTLYVLEKALEIGLEENCTEHEIKLLTAAALWHDTGYIKTYKQHEEEGCEMAGLYLPGYGYSMSDIETVKGMIMATQIPQSPKNKLEEIIADADLEYLGTESAREKATLLYKELHSLNPLLTTEEWNKTQISFIEHHHYFTQYCKENNEPVKQLYLNTLRHHS